MATLYLKNSLAIFAIIFIVYALMDGSGSTVVGFDEVCTQPSKIKSNTNGSASAPAATTPSARKKREATQNKICNYAEGLDCYYKGDAEGKCKKISGIPCNSSSECFAGTCVTGSNDIMICLPKKSGAANFLVQFPIATLLFAVLNLLAKLCGEEEYFIL